MGNKYPALLTGPVGTGKTSTAQSVLNSLDQDKYLILQINMSAQVFSLLKFLTYCYNI